VPLEAPDVLLHTYADCRWTEVSEYSMQRAWRLECPGSPDRYLKVKRVGAYPTLAEEASRLRWARPFVSVPEVVDEGSDGQLDWLLTASLGGRSAIEQPEPFEPVVVACARGLRELHDALPTSQCPFEFGSETAIEHARRRVEAGVVDPDRDFHDEHRHLTPTAALAELRRLRPGREDVVVCHGDYCAPNVLLTDGRVSGWVDLGELGVADRWWDIAVGAWSAGWNFGPRYEEVFRESYGVGPDPDRQAFYRLLYDLVS
jgi:kanamycin kinase